MQHCGVELTVTEIRTPHDGEPFAPQASRLCYGEELPTDTDLAIHAGTARR
jgi:hypothetical protein